MSVAYTNDTISSFTLGESEFSNLAFTWTQDVPYPGKRRLAGAVARAEIDVAGQSVDAALARLRADIKSAYTEIVRIDRTDAILAESRSLLEGLIDATRVRYETGDGILANVLRARTELAKLDADRAMLVEERRQSEARLAALVGRTSLAAFGPAGPLPVVEDPGREALMQAAAERSPELLTLRAETRRQASRVDLAQRNLKPDFVWSAAYFNRGGLDPMVMGMFGIRLPLYHNQKQREAVAQSEYDLEAARRETESRETEIVSRIGELLARAERASTLARLYDEGILPQAQGALESAAAAYKVGRSDFIGVIEDFLGLRRYRIDREKQVAERIEAFAALEPLTGLTLVVPGQEAEGPRGTSAGGER